MYNPPAAPTPFERHCALVAKLIAQGKVVPFLGAGVNLAGLPTGHELAESLAAEYNYPSRPRCARTDCGLSPAPDLLRVSQYVQVTLETGPLYESLRRVFELPHGPTPVHDFLAGIPARIEALRAAQQEAAMRRSEPALRPEDLVRFPTIVTTNYDDLMEQAFEAHGREYDLVFYRPARSREGGTGAFWHRSPDGSSIRIERANAYPFAFGRERPVVLKIHGTISRSQPEAEGFVITEDDYIEYLALQALETLLPQSLLGQLQTAHLLFLGYSLRDWNCRVFLRRLWSDETRRHKAWAVMHFSDPNDEELDQAFWARNGVNIWSKDLLDYISTLTAELGRIA